MAKTVNLESDCMKYREEASVTKNYKENYQKRKKEAENIRGEYAKDIFLMPRNIATI